jgi:hypothetical protein
VTRAKVFETLKKHHARTGQVMTTEEIIIASGAAPHELMAGRRLFDKYLDLKRGKAA